MTFKRYVEVGRVVLINAGPDAGKLGTIVEIIDHNKAIIDGPSVTRSPLAYRHLSLTPYKLSKLPRAAGTTTVKKVFEASGVADKWAASSWAKKLAARKAKAQANDFQRFEILLLKKQRRRVLGAATKKVAA